MNTKTVEKARNARRYHGRGQMGRATSREIDRKDLTTALTEIGKAIRGLDRIGDPSNANRPRTELEIELDEIYSHGRLALRTLLGVLRRNDYGLESIPLPESGV